MPASHLNLMKTKIYIFLLAASGLAFPYQDQVSEKVETERINGVLCKNNESWIRYLYKDAQPWTPTAEQVGATEQSLNLYLKQEPHTYALWTRTERQTFWKKMAGYKGLVAQILSHCLEQLVSPRA
jgi:hypothetical protein